MPVLGPHVSVSDLPGVLPVFPLDAVLLLPRGMLPLNIFEPRYLNMIDDAMAGDRTIGMVQTRVGGDRERPALAAVGCAGRVTSFAETPDGRYVITLTGLCRFRLKAELSAPTPYRQTRADFGEFAQDLDQADDAPFDRATLLAALKRYLSRREMDVDWKTVGDAPIEALVNSLSMALPFEAAEKQALLEAQTLIDRADALSALLTIGAAEGEPDTPPSLQ